MVMSLCVFGPVLFNFFFFKISWFLHRLTIGVFLALAKLRIITISVNIIKCVCVKVAIFYNNVSFCSVSTISKAFGFFLKSAVHDAITEVDYLKFTFV